MAHKDKPVVNGPGIVTPFIEDGQVTMRHDGHVWRQHPQSYPAESRVVDTANQFHLWCVQFTFPFGFHSRLSLDTDEMPLEGAVQRPFAESPRV